MWLEYWGVAAVRNLDTDTVERLPDPVWEELERRIAKLGKD
jgi:hypothetical protein